jgi:hypothetical protein
MSTETPPASPEEGSPLPAIVAGVAILGVAAFLIFGGGSSEEATEKTSSAKSSQSADRAEEVVAGGGGRVRGGVGARSIDDAKGRSTARRNPKLGAPMEGMKLDPTPRPKEPPDFQSAAEEIEYYEKKLEREREILVQRERFVERLEKVKKEAVSAEEREVAEGRGKIVTDNYAKQQQVVEELEKKLEGLRG